LLLTQFGRPGWIVFAAIFVAAGLAAAPIAEWVQPTGHRTLPPRAHVPGPAEPGSRAADDRA
jgi:hypothetical protein